MMLGSLALARRLEAAEASNGLECTKAQALAHPEIGPLALPVCGGYALFVGCNSPLTHAIGLGLNGPVREVELEQMEAFFRSRGACVTVDLCPLADPSLTEFLSLRGYRVTEFNNVMAKTLTAADAAADDPRVRRAAPSEADLWAEAAGFGFFEGKNLSAEEINVGLNIFQMASAACYLAVPENGGVAATAAVAMHDGVASFFADSTLPTARRQGWHTTLIRTRLQAAVAQGCDLAVASALPGSISERNYERCGFQVVYTRVVLAG